MRRQSVRGMTLIEALVATVISLVIVGGLIGLLIQTSRMARRSVGVESLWADAQSIARALDTSLRNYVPPSTDRGFEAEADLFEMDKLAFHSITPGRATVERVVVDNVEGEKGVAARITHGAGGDREQANKYGAGERQSMRISFRFAYEFNGLAPVWVDQALPGRQPRLVEYVIAGQDDGVPTVKLSGAVAPGA